MLTDKRQGSEVAKSNPPVRLGTREAQRAAKRDAVLDAAITLFAGRGFEGTTLPAITAACGVPVPLIIYHFRSKDELWRDSVDEIYRRLKAHVASFERAIAQATGTEFYRANIRAHITAVAAHPEYMRILFQEGTQDSERLVWLVNKHQSRMTALLTTLIERAQREGYVPEMDLVHAKFIFSGAFILPIALAAEYRLVGGVDPLDPGFVDRHIDTCIRLLLPGLAAS